MEPSGALWASALYHGEFAAVRARYLELERQLATEPRGEQRDRLVDEAHLLKYRQPPRSV